MIGGNGPSSRPGTGLGSALSRQAEANMQRYFAQNGDPAKPVAPPVPRPTDDKEGDVDDGEKKRRRAKTIEPPDEQTKAGPLNYPQSVLDAAAIADDEDHEGQPMTVAPTTSEEPATTRRKKGGVSINK